jgi:hypothetical protein
VGGAIICVTKLQAINVQIKNPKMIRLVLMVLPVIGGASHFCETSPPKRRRNIVTVAYSSQ